MDGVAPLLVVGNGKVPRMWPTVPARSLAPIGALVADQPDFIANLMLEAHGRRVKVSLTQDTLLSATLGDDDTLMVQKLNLRPLGLNIFFDSAGDGLHAMGSTMRCSMLLGVPIALVLR